MLGDKFLQKQYRKSKPKEITVSLLSLVEAYHNMLLTLKVIQSYDHIVATDGKVTGDSINLKIYTKKEVQSRTRKD